MSSAPSQKHPPILLTGTTTIVTVDVLESHPRADKCREPARRDRSCDGGRWAEGSEHCHI